MDLINLKFVKLSSNIKTPSKSTKFAVGLDIHSPATYIISAKDQAIIPTGLRIQIPPGHYGHLCSKSGLAMQHHVHVRAGIIDPDYTGEVKVLLLNLGHKPFQVSSGDAIAQLILEKVSTPILQRVDTLPSTNRGDRGCGLPKSNTL